MVFSNNFGRTDSKLIDHWMNILYETTSCMGWPVFGTIMISATFHCDRKWLVLTTALALLVLCLVAPWLISLWLGRNLVLSCVYITPNRFHNLIHCYYFDWQIYLVRCFEKWLDLLSGSEAVGNGCNTFTRRSRIVSSRPSVTYDLLFFWDIFLHLPYCGCHFIQFLSFLSSFTVYTSALSLVLSTGGFAFIPVLLSFLLLAVASFALLLQFYCFLFFCLGYQDWIPFCLRY